MAKKRNVQWLLELEQMALLKGHKLINIQRNAEGDITSRSEVTLFCKKCKINFVAPSIYSYKQALLSCPSCLGETQSKNRVVGSRTEAAKQKALDTRRANIAKKRLDFFEQNKTTDLVALQSIQKGGSTTSAKHENNSSAECNFEQYNANLKNEPSAAWKAVMFQAYKGKCFIDKTPGTKNDPLVIHHLFSRDAFPELTENLANGVLIKQSYHKLFHKYYGLGKNTPDQFEDFLQKNFKNVIFDKYPWRLDTFKTQNIELIQRFEIQQKYFESQFMHVLKERGHTLISYQNEQNQYESVKTKVLISCTKCEIPATEITTIINYKKAKYGLSCCAKINKKKSKGTLMAEGHDKENSNVTLMAESHDKENSNVTLMAESHDTKALQQKWSPFFELLQQRNHQYVECVDAPFIVTPQSCVRLECLTHGSTFVISVHNYIRSKHGLKCCAKALLPKKQAEIFKKHANNIDLLFGKAVKPEEPI